MAGYFRKLQGYVYDGSHLSAEPLTNGTFVEITPVGVAVVTGAKDMKLRVSEKATLFGMPALVLDVVSVGNDPVYFVENEWDVSNAEEWDDAKYTLETGKQVRMKRALPGEQMIMTVSDTLYNALSVGDVVTPAAGGTVA